jgi:hypothetical protein
LIDRDECRAFITEGKWPSDILPMKHPERLSKRFSDAGFGLVRKGSFDVEPYPGDTERETEHYTTVDQLLDAGWRVD